MKRFFSMLVIAVILYSLCACGESVQNFITQPSSKAATTTVKATTTATEAETTVIPPEEKTTDDGFIYTETDSGITVTGYTGAETSIEIPQVIDGKEIVEIGFGAFRDSDIKSVTVPFGVRKIGAYSFYKSSLENIEIPETVTVIGNNAFSYTNLTEFESPLGISVIGFEVFSFCDKLHLVILGSNIDEIQEGAFACCQSLEAVYVPSSVDYIADDAFEGWLVGLVIYGKEHSSAEQYAEDNGMEFEIV